MEGARMSRQAAKHFNDAFKRQIVELHAAGKSVIDICREYDLKDSTVHGWIKRYKDCGSFHAKDARTPEEQELIDLRKENRQLKMEVDILKQAALIFAQK